MTTFANPDLGNEMFVIDGVLYTNVPVGAAQIQRLERMEKSAVVDGGQSIPVINFMMANTQIITWYFPDYITRDGQYDVLITS